MYDVIIIGAGITGTLIAKDLAGYNLNVALVEKENDIADGATMANSAIVHTGYDPKDGTLKAKCNVEGARMYKQLCKDLGCLYKVTGAYIAAVGDEEEKIQDVLKQRAIDREVPYELLTGDQARAEEPNLSDDVTRVLSFPTTAVIYPWEVACACAEVAYKNGVEVRLSTEVTNIEKLDGYYKVSTNNGDLEGRVVINAAGVAADKIARMVEEDPGFVMTPRKGEYFVIDNNIDYVNHVIFPVPSASKGKGVLAVPTVYGNTLLGPNSAFVDDPDDVGSSYQGLDYVRENVGKILKNAPLRHVIRNFAGLRPSSSSKDFIIEESKTAKGFVNVASIESPGLASAPSISKMVVTEILPNIIDMEVNENADLTRTRPIVMEELSDEERAAVIKENPAYGRMICRCEQISEGEIVECINRPCGARSVKAVKKRVRPGMGKCQGGFCEPLVVGILARELGVHPTEVVLDSKQSNILEKENR